MNISLQLVTPGGKQSIQVIKYKLLNGDAKYVEMRPQTYTTEISHESCTANVSLKIKALIVTEQKKPNMFNMICWIWSSYRKWFSWYKNSVFLIISKNGYCDVTGHKNQCLLEAPTTIKVFSMKQKIFLMNFCTLLNLSP